MNDEQRANPTGETEAAPDDPLPKKAQEVEHLYKFVDHTSFDGDEREVGDELSGLDQHPADTADITLQREDDYAAKLVLEHEREQIRKALQRRQAGTYGICANCGRLIPKDRLNARPEAIYCIDCQRLMEGRR
jgi:RNA polymerase-binding transcription factor DksA